LDGRVPQWAVPNAIEFVAAIPLTAVEKVDRPTLEDQSV
jgi:non-ribosomal peptide synthetase component E (peptide arylation enzyme)